MGSDLIVRRGRDGAFLAASEVLEPDIEITGAPERNTTLLPSALTDGQKSTEASWVSRCKSPVTLPRLGSTGKLHIVIGDEARENHARPSDGRLGFYRGAKR